MNVDEFPDFEYLLELAEKNAAKFGEINFVSSLRERFDRLGKRLNLSLADMGNLERISGVVELKEIDTEF